MVVQRTSTWAVNTRIFLANHGLRLEEEMPTDIQATLLEGNPEMKGDVENGTGGRRDIVQVEIQSLRRKRNFLSPVFF